MTPNTVILPVEEYNRLRDFEFHITNGMIGFKSRYSETIQYYKENEVINHLNQEKDKMLDDLKKADNEISELRTDIKNLCSEREKIYNQLLKIPEKIRNQYC